MIEVLLINLLVVVAYIIVVFFKAKQLNRIDLVDIAWGGAFILGALASLIQRSQAISRLVFVLILIWGLRLAFHIRHRFQHSEQDPRYTEIAKKWGDNIWPKAFANIFLVQAVLAWAVALPISFAANASDSIGGYALAGIIVWVIGFIFESLGDHQLRLFLTDDTNKDKVMDQGLWRYTRHPNYFGEITQWWGIGLIALAAPFGWIGLLGPVLLTFLIVKVSGIPPIENRKKDDPAYQEYQQHTSVLIPLPRQK